MGRRRRNPGCGPVHGHTDGNQPSASRPASFLSSARYCPVNLSPAKGAPFRSTGAGTPLSFSQKDVRILRRCRRHCRLLSEMRWSIRHVLALMFAVLLAAGASLSAAQANNMAIQMAMASNMGMPVAGDCTACPDQGADDGKMTVCPQTCVGPVLALVPLNLAAVMVAPALDMMPLPSPHLHGRAAMPDPYPPKPFRPV